MAPPVLLLRDTARWQEVVAKVSSNKHVVFVTGAGISTSAGIVDFRSKDGLYTKTIKEGLLDMWHAIQDTSSGSDLITLEQLFDQIDRPTQKLACSELFNHSVFTTRSRTMAFYRFYALLYLKITKPQVRASKAHHFIKEVGRQGRLLQHLTQNIDGLGDKDRIDTQSQLKDLGEKAVQDGELDTDGCQSQDQVVSLHGNVHELVCQKCRTIVGWNKEAIDVMLQGQAVECPQCRQEMDRRQQEGRRRVTPGTLRPNVVLYGESHPRQDAIDHAIRTTIAGMPQVVVIMGTSLSSSGIQRLVQDLARKVHKTPKGYVIYVNRTPLQGSKWDGVVDAVVPMECDEWVDNIVQQEPDQWSGLQMSVSPQPVISSHLWELHPSLRTQPRRVQDQAWLDTYF